MKKPQVNTKRLTSLIYLEYDLEIEDASIDELFETLKILENEAEQNPDKCSKVFVSRDYYGYDGGSNLRVYYEAWSESKGAHKERVEKEIESLEKWQEWKKNRDEAANNFNEEFRLRRIKEMEEELLKLKEEV